MTARNNQQIGRLAQFVGATFETWLDGQHVFAKHQGILSHIEHNQPKFAFLKGRWKPVKKSVADYTGTLEGGWTIAVEAKSCGEERFNASEVDAKQAAHMATVARSGGSALALLLVEFRKPYVRRFAVPWLQVPWRVLRSAQTVSADELAAWQIAPDTCYLSRFHKGGPSSSPGIQRTYARE